MNNIQRKSIRLKNYDYSQDGMYFITLCTHNRECLFGEIKNGQMIMNNFAMIVFDEWIKSPEIRSEITIDEFVVMPNHFHGIAVISSVGNRSGRPPVAPTMTCGRGGRYAARSIGSLIGRFKSSVTKQINTIRKTPAMPIWQRNYYEHIIRDEKSLCRIREYIVSNPANWHEDKMNPLNFNLQ